MRNGHVPLRASGSEALLLHTGRFGTRRLVALLAALVGLLGAALTVVAGRSPSTDGKD
jgi:hypothetical protein